jgi:hypothetical protein
LTEALSRYVGPTSCPARRLVARWVCRPDQQAEAAQPTAANSNVAASLTRALNGMRPLAVDVARRPVGDRRHRRSAGIRSGGRRRSGRHPQCPGGRAGRSIRGSGMSDDDDNHWVVLIPSRIACSSGEFGASSFAFTAAFAVATAAALALVSAGVQWQAFWSSDRTVASVSS